MADFQDKSSRDAQTAAELQADVGVEHVASVYAKALLGAAGKIGQLDAVLAEFDALVGEVLDKFPRFEAILASWLVSHEETSGVLDRVLGGRVSPTLLDFLKVVSRHGRLDCLRAIHRMAHALRDEMAGRIPVELITAAPVDGAVLARLTEQLRGLVDGEPVVRQTVDADLIGGAVVRVGDTVYDGSILTQLELLRQQMIDRSVHEIQSRRDRFRNPA